MYRRQRTPGQQGVELPGRPITSRELTAEDVSGRVRVATDVPRGNDSVPP